MGDANEKHIETMLELTRRVVRRIQTLPLLSAKTRPEWERVFADIEEQEAVATAGNFADALPDIRACKNMIGDVLHEYSGARSSDRSTELGPILR